MQLRDIFRKLSFGELSNLALSNSGNGYIRPADYGRVAHAVEEGLLRLYTLFPIMTKTIYLEMFDHITDYVLEPRFATSAASQEIFRYIRDIPDDPFCGDVIRILSASDWASGSNIPLNDPHDALSFTTPAPHTLRVNYPSLGRILQVEYQAKHHQIYEPSLNPENDPQDLRFLSQHIELPDNLMGALQAYVGHSIFSHMEGDGNAARSQALLARFQTLCSEVTYAGTVASSVSKSEPVFDQRGFV